MKTMRYRIRVIALVLLASLLVVLSLAVRSIWFPSVPSESFPEATETVSVDSPDPEESPVVESVSPSPQPLYDTYGL